MDPARQSAQADSRRAYVTALRDLTDEELLHEFRFRESLPDLSAEVEAEMRRRRPGNWNNPRPSVKQSRSR